MANYGSDEIAKRLIIILTRLNNGEQLSITGLADDFNHISTRTIQRDFNERLISFPLDRNKKKWKMQDGFRYENHKSIEEAVIRDMFEKLIKSAGEEFAFKVKKVLNIDIKLDMEDIGTYPAIDEILSTNDNLIKSKQGIKSYFNAITIALMQHINNSSQTLLGTLQNEKYHLIGDGDNNQLVYNSVDELVDAGWMILIKAKIFQ